MQIFAMTIFPVARFSRAFAQIAVMKRKIALATMFFNDKVQKGRSAVMEMFELQLDLQMPVTLSLDCSH